MLKNNMFRRIILFITTLFLANHSMADTYLELMADPADCLVKEYGYGVKKNPIYIEGEKKIISGMTPYCLATVKEENFEKNFKFCFLTSVQTFNTTRVEKGYGNCSFRHVKGVGYQFDFTKSPHLECSYTCILK